MSWVSRHANRGWNRRGAIGVVVSMRRLLASGAGVVAVLAGAALLLAARGPAAVSVHDGAVRETCATRSMADFPGAFTKRRNLVAGPLALMGGATFTDAATVRRFGGNKFPLLVRAGHTVTVAVAPRARVVAALGYGPLPQGEVTRRDGHDKVTFVACRPDEDSGSRADGRPVTFWSGFVLIDTPLCLPLDVYADDRPRRRVALALGRRCGAPAPPLRDCASRVEGGRPLSELPRPAGEVAVGPLTFAGLGRVASRAGLEHQRDRRGYGIKAGVGVPAGVSATLSIGRRARGWAALTYAPRRPDGVAAVRLRACAADEPAFSYDGPVGPTTGFSGGFVVRHPGCVPLEVRVAGRPVVRARVPFGTGRCA
jgi:hypothetical protein